MNRKLGVYICGGCSIAESVPLDALADVARKEYKVPVCRTHAFLCGPEGLETIRADIRDGTADTVVIAACSPRVKTEVFVFDGTLVERVNLREHVAWCQAPGDEDTRALAEDYLRMGIVKAQKTEAIVPLSDPISKTLLVVGGGVAGITAALEAAAAGYEVVLVERAADLGGFGVISSRREPSLPPYDLLAANDLPEQIKTVQYHPKVKVLTGAVIEKTEGQPGMFDVTIRHAAQTVTVRVGAIVLATGWKPYDATRLSGLGYGLPGVVTNVEFERMLASGQVRRPGDNQPVKSVLFVQCAGSRDAAHLSYCSAACCTATLRHVASLHEDNPDLKAYVIYKDMRTPGQYERFFQAVQNHPASFFTRGEVTGVRAAADGRLDVTVGDSTLGEPIRVQVDLVVLATGMVPNSADGEAIRALMDATQSATTAESEKQRTEAARKVEELRGHAGTEILHLTYRQGPDLPVLTEGFPDSHFICFPYETRRTGIYAAGTVRAPMDAERVEVDARGAAMKAIQCVELASRGRAVHPRAGDTSYPSFLLQRCTQCKRCTEECPFGTLDEDAKGTPKPNLYRCRRCGICLGACPERIISFPNYSVDMIASMIKAIEVPEEEEEKTRVVVLMCENDAYPALDLAGVNRLRYDPSVRVIPLRCLGSLNIVWIADALSRGIDGVMLVGCKYGDDYQCHFVKGSELANRRLENVKETLQRLQLESERIHLTQLGLGDYMKLPDLINEFVEQVRETGPNPYKGF
jgi:quinone-modifying oxidoreductase subunit QmoB